MDKTILRDKLFDKYFEVEDGIEAADLVNKLSFIPELWKKLHALCEKNIKHFDALSYLEKFRALKHNQKKYLILKLEMFHYIIIDMEKMENIPEEQFRNEFDENFFVNNFDESKIQNRKCDMYNIDSYNGNVQELVDFYIENQSIFSLSTELDYRLEIGNAWTYFYIDFVNASAQIGFQTPDQFLYEQLFLKYDLSASRMQDAQSRIGIERMQEMFKKIMEIKIPKDVIPKDLYQQFLVQSSIENHNLNKSYKKL